MNQKIHFAVAGIGHIGRRHAEMILRHPEAVLVAVADVRKPETFLAENPEVRYYADLTALLQREEALEVVNIATPNSLHAPLALEVLKAGKNVVLEKPITLSLQDAEAIRTLAAATGLKVFPVMQNRYSPPAQWIREVVSAGLLGAVYLVQLNCFWNRDARYYQPGGWHGVKALDGGTLFTQFSHFIDMMYWLFGDIRNIRSRFFDFNHQQLTDFEDSGMVTFDFEQGGAGVLHFSTAVWDRNQESSLTIVAENGSVKIGGQYMERVEYCHIRDYRMPELPPTQPGNDYGGYKGSAQNHDLVIRNVIDVLRGRDRITTRLEEGIAVVDIIERIYKAPH